jgi:hypothetical protein
MSTLATSWLTESIHAKRKLDLERTPSSWEYTSGKLHRILVGVCRARGIFPIELVRLRVDKYPRAVSPYGASPVTDSQC